MFFDSERHMRLPLGYFSTGRDYIYQSVLLQALSFPFLQYKNHELHVLNAKENKLQQTETWFSLE